MTQRTEELEDELATLRRAYAELEGHAEAMAGAVEGLPVEDWVEQGPHGEPHLLGYVMQAQGEWDDARFALTAYRKWKGEG